jgi:catechol 2,3-dioxygenase-like lactoylglutathione lyase family enzyme
MHIDHVVIWVKNAKRSLDFYINTLGFESVREKEFLDSNARFPSVRINENTIFDIMESDELLPLVQNFTGGEEGIGGYPINHICLSMTQEEYESIVNRLETSGVRLTPGGKDVFGAQGQAVRSTYFNDPDGNVLEVRYYAN